MREGVKVRTCTTAGSGRRSGVDARVVIGADGCNGTSAKPLGLGADIVHGVALEANFPYEARFARRDGCVEIAVVPGGYGWVFPKARPRQRRRRR